MIYKQLVVIIQVLCLCQFAFSLPQKTDQTPKAAQPPKVFQQITAEQPPQPPETPKINGTAIVAPHHNATNNTTPPYIFPDSNSTYSIVSANATLLNMSCCDNAPHVFPDNDPNYKILNNETILDSLVSHQAKHDNKIDTEVPDLLKMPAQVELLPNATLSNKTHEQSGNATIEIATTSSVKKQLTTPRTTTVHDREFDVEQIQSDVSKTEDSKIDITAKLAAVHEDHDHANRAGTPMVHGQLAAILAGVFAMIAVVAYVGLLTWRRFLERRYGNREMLVNEEEYVNYSDMRNFEL
ncbi:hypothetical protein CBL_05391 [Carabus blaptoides fortunei]